MDPQDDDSSSTASEESIPYSPSTPYIIDLEYDNGKSYEYEALFSKELVDFGPSFQLPQSVNATPEALCELFLPDSLLDRWVVCTNDYAASHLPPARQRVITRMDILRFLSAVSYMGVVRLPAKADYFAKDNDVFPHNHAITINQTVFDYLWRNFHTSYKAGSGVLDQEIGDDDDDNDDSSDQRRRRRRSCRK